MFKNYLKKKGYIRREDVRHLIFTDEEIIEIINRSFGDINPDDTIIDPDDEARLFKELAGVDGLQDYLRKTMAMDMKMAFSAEPIQQMRLRGAFQKMATFRKKLRDKGDKPKVKNLKVSSARYL